MIRKWFFKEQFLELQTPLVTSYSSLEPNLEPFLTFFKDNREKRYHGFLRMSPEFSLKKALAYGYNKIFEIGPCFRSAEPITSRFHSSEFTLLEWYRLNADYHKIASDLISILVFIAKKLFKKKSFFYQGSRIDLKKVEKITIKKAFQNYADIDFNSLKTWNDLVTIAHKKGYSKVMTPSDAFNIIFLGEIEPFINRSNLVFLYDYPEFEAVFSKTTIVNKKIYAKRFELYLAGIEVANAYSELTDPTAQLSRMKQYQKQLQLSKKVHFKIDPAFIKCLEKIPSASGVALGIDRLIMILTNAYHIQDVILLPSKDLFDKPPNL